MTMENTSVIIGCSSGIGKALLDLHIEQNLPVIAASHKPESITVNSPNVELVKLDLKNQETVENQLSELFSIPNIATVHLVSGTGHLNPELATDLALDTTSLNCDGFSRAALASARYFQKQGHGHLIAVTSVAAIRGSSIVPSYNASKAYQSSFLEGLRCKFQNSKLPVHITEIRAGFVDTAMMQTDKAFWVASPEKAARQIFATTKTKRSIVYVSKRWIIIGMLLRIMPKFIYNRIGA